jgi:DUF2075 family protein/SOS-response transcriptional repressor LexA/DNA replication protein DnaC
MSKIVTFPFDHSEFANMKKFEHGLNWPVVYLIEDGKELYIGETTSVATRSKQHYEKENRKKLTKIHVVSDDEYNKSATLDTESLLIQYMFADNVFTIQNANKGLSNHNYFDKQKYTAKFEMLWEKLREMSLVRQSLSDLKNTDLFKFSPYKTLTEEQLQIASQLITEIPKKETSTFIINGKPGTGKTILGMYLAKSLLDHEDTKHLKVGLVVPMTSLRKTLSKVVSKIKGMKSSMVLGPGDIIDGMYDVLIVDESHRLRQRRNITNYAAHDKANKNLGLSNEGTELDWVMKSSKHQIFLYDANQSVRPSDVSHSMFKKMNAVRYELLSQLRVEGGEAYLDFIDSLFEGEKVSSSSFAKYDFKIFSDVGEMYREIKKKEAELSLCRMVAGYAWKWASKDDMSLYDIKIENNSFRWNSVAQDWVNSPDAINEVGCIHTVQGYDLNYVGLIIGPELSYDKVNKRIVIKKEHYHDANGWRGVDDEEELRRYIINIYKTLATRGIKGAYMYFVDNDLREYVNSMLHFEGVTGASIQPKKVVSPYTGGYIQIPLFDSIGCGDFMYADPTVQEMISVKESLVSKGSKYFVLRTKGDSMNKAGVNDGDLILCTKNYSPSNGAKVVALIGDDATLKIFEKIKDAILLKPCSTNPRHKVIRVEEGEEVKVQGVMVKVLSDVDFG